MEWIDSYFDELYMKYFLETQKEEVTEKQIELISRFLPDSGYILDAGCGIGRHSLALAKRGYRVLGIDFCPLYVQRATELSKEMNLDLQFKVKDMRENLGEEMFDAIINLWSSFGYFDEKTNEQVIFNFSRALKKKGVLIIDVENRDYILKHFVYETFREKEDVLILERRKFNAVTSIVTTHRYFVFEKGRREYTRHLRIYTATELVNILHNAGLEVANLFGNYDGLGFHIESPRIIAVANKIQ